LSAEFYAFGLCFVNALHLAFRTDFCFKLSDCPKHIKHQPACGVGRVDMLVKDVQINFFAVKNLGNLAQMQSRTGKAV
jgi:hypothetical protein